VDNSDSYQPYEKYSVFRETTDYYDDVAIGSNGYPRIVGLVKYVNFEAGSDVLNHVVSHTGGTVDSSPDPVLDGSNSLELKRTGNGANVVIGQVGLNTFNLATAYYSFLFEYTSNDATQGDIADFQTSSGAVKASLYLNSADQLVFKDSAGKLLGTGTTKLNAGEVYQITVEVGTGANAAWQVRINGYVEMSGAGNLLISNNGSINLGGAGSMFNDTYFYDDLTISSVALP
jgi:hypothetical protein